MAYRRYGRRSYGRRSYGRRGYGTRRRSYRSGSYRRSYRRYPRRRTSAPRIVVQVVGGAGGVAASPVSLGMKAAKPVRSRY